MYELNITLVGNMIYGEEAELVTLIVFVSSTNLFMTTKTLSSAYLLVFHLLWSEISKSRPPK
jgi:hypothetical protein